MTKWPMRASLELSLQGWIEAVPKLVLALEAPAPQRLEKRKQRADALVRTGLVC